MRFNKTSVAVLAVLALAVFNFLFFLWTTPETRDAVAWVTYGFTTFAFLVATGSLLWPRRDDGEVYNLTTVYLPLRYFVLQLVAGVAAIYYHRTLAVAREAAATATEKASSLIDRGLDAVGASDSIKAVVADAANLPQETVAQSGSFVENNFLSIVLTVYVLLLAFYGFRLAIHSMANTATADSLRQQAVEHSYISQCTDRLRLLQPRISDPAAAKAVRQLAEAIRFSPNSVSGAGRALESEVVAGIGQLADLIGRSDWNGTADLARQLTQLAKDRNR